MSYSNSFSTTAPPFIPIRLLELIVFLGEQKGSNSVGHNHKLPLSDMQDTA